MKLLALVGVAIGVVAVNREWMRFYGCAPIADTEPADVDLWDLG